MNKLLVLIILVAVGFYVYTHGGLNLFNSLLKPSNTATSVMQGEPTVETSTQGEAVKVVATGLDTPWAIAVLPDGTLLVTERAGRVRVVDMDGKLLEGPAVTLDKVKEKGEGGLLGIALDPKFESNTYVYVYYTYTADANSLNRIARLTYDAETHTLGQETTVLDSIPGNSNHNGGRIKFGPDGFLYVGTGDAENPSQAQDTNTLGGKVLRLTTAGEAAPGNPFNNFTYSYGHRNVQGLAWNAAGELWQTEHGPSGLDTGYDEVNMIESGKNYGWSVIKGDQTKDGMESPKKQSGKGTAWAPSGAAFVGNSMYFSGLRGQALYEAVISGGKVIDFKEHLKGTYGRIREVVAGPEGKLYITTSNKDSRGTPKAEDDKILLVDPSKL